MKVNQIRTGKITPTAQTLYQILDAHLGPMPEGSVLAITSKIVAICEGRVVKIEAASDSATYNEDRAATLRALVETEADRFLEPGSAAEHPVSLTIKNHILIASAGIDESNGNGYFVMWPANPQKTANAVRSYLKKRFSLKEVGVIITDSKTTPLKRGTSGVALAHSGFKALRNYIDKPDIFGRVMTMTQANILEGLAAAAVVAMGEGNEQTPLAVIEDVPFVEFQKRNPITEELKMLHIKVKDDLYSAMLTAIPWKKGKGGGKI